MSFYFPTSISALGKHHASNYFFGTSAEFDLSQSSFIFSLFFFNNELTWTAKTSGVLIVAGVSSYCVYKLCGKFLGRRFVWALLDSKPLNVTGESKYFSCNSTTSSLFDVSEDVYKTLTTSQENEKESDEEIIEGETTSIKKYHVNLSFPKKDYRKKGLTALSIIEADEEDSGNKKNIIEKACSLSRLSPSPNSILSEPQNVYAIRRRQRMKNDSFEKAENDDLNSSSVSVKSANFNLTWDTEQAWDDEFYDNLKTDIPNQSSSSDFSCVTDSFNSVGMLLRNILDDKIDDENSIFKTQYQTPIKDDTINDIDSELNSMVMEDLSIMINSKCMQNSKHLYKSVIIGGSEFDKSPSVRSFVTDKSNLSKFKEKVNRSNIRGLVDLSPMMENDMSFKNNTTVSRTQLNINSFNSPMTDSLFSKESYVSSNTASKINYAGSLNQKAGQMFDSAIVPDYLNDEDIRSLSSTNNNVNNNIFRLPNLTQIYERDLSKNSITSIKSVKTGSYITKSVQSLEWCDDMIFDGDSSFETESLNNNSALENKIFNELKVDVDYATFQLFPELSPTKSFTSESHYSVPLSEASDKSNNLQNNTNITNISKQDTILSPKNDLRLKSTRDFMIVIRENFKSCETNKMKLANFLYSTKRLKRIRYSSNGKNSSCAIDSFLENVLHSMVYGNASFFNCSSFSVIQKATINILEQFDYLRRWNLLSKRKMIQRTSISTNDETIKGILSNNAFEKEILTYLYALWKLQHDVCGIEEIKISPEAIEGAKFLMVLKSISVFQYIFEYSKNNRCRSFYSHLFAKRNPKQIMLKLNDTNETIDHYDLALFGDTVNVKIQLFDFSLKNMSNHNICSIYPSTDCKYGNEIYMVKLKEKGSVFPLYHLPDDIFFA